MTKIKKSKCKCCKSETDYLLSSEANSDRLNEAIMSFKKNSGELKKITPQGLFDLGFEESYQEPEGCQAGFLYYYINEEECGVDILSNEGGTEVEIGGVLKVKDLNLLGEFVAALLNIKERAYSEELWEEK